MADQSSVTPQRVQSIDALRALAIFGVVAIHCDPFVGREYGAGGVNLGDVVDLLARFAVPFFFALSGYLLNQKCIRTQKRWECVGSFLVRIGGLVVFWYAFYLIWPFDWSKVQEYGWIRTTYWSALTLFSDVAHFLGGSRAHLWFLSALFISCAHVALASLLGLRAFAPPYFFGLYAVGLAKGAYSVFSGSELLTTMPDIPPNLLLAPLLVALGWWSAEKGGCRPLTAWLLFAVGSACTFVEAWVLLQKYGVPLHGHDFLIGTPMQALGLLHLARAYPEWAGRTPLRTWGSYTLGVYAAHVAVIELVAARVPGGFLWELLKTPLVYLVTLGAVLLLAKLRPLRPFFT